MSGSGSGSGAGRGRAGIGREQTGEDDYGGWWQARKHEVQSLMHHPKF